MDISNYHYGQESDTVGNMILIYGDSGVGKGATTIQTAEDPIFWIISERGQVDLTIKAINRPDVRLRVGYYTGWEDLLTTLYEPKWFNQIKTVVFDSITHVMNIHLADEIMAENYDAADKSKIEKDLSARAKMSLEGFGVMSKQMNRLMKGFELLTKRGIDVICTARSQENPKWDRSLAAAPALAGKEFSRDFKGFWDFIGYLQPNVQDGKIIYPPLISCEDDGSYLSKWTGIKPPGGVIRKPFNVKKMLDVAHGRLIVPVRKEGE